MRSLVLFLACLIYVLRLNYGAHNRHAVERSPRQKNETSKNDEAPHYCGNRSSSLRPPVRIVGGGPSALGEWPWMAALYYGRKRRGKWTKSSAACQCGGSLISDQWVLTAAHCLSKSYEKYQLKFVRLGDLDLRAGIRDGAEPVDVPIRRTIRHSRYREWTKENDIALLLLDKKVNFTENIYPICLLSGSQYMANQYYHEKVGIVAGWGVIDPESIPHIRKKRRSNFLKHVEVYFGDCKENSNEEALGQAVLDERVLCAGDTKSDSCHGDSGGPLMIENTTTGLYYQAGIVSWGMGCAAENYPGVYTKVPAFIRWINEKTGLNF